MARLLAATALAVFPDTATAGPTRQDQRDARPDTVRRAVTFIDEHAHEDITIADIAAAAFVTVRAVHLAFRRHLDTTPMEYPRRVRLDHAHRDLLAADPASRTVTAIAYRWGFSNASRFATRYQEAYGVRPSHTVHQDQPGQSLDHGKARQGRGRRAGTGPVTNSQVAAGGWLRASGSRVRGGRCRSGA